MAASAERMSSSTRSTTCFFCHVECEGRYKCPRCGVYFCSSKCYAHPNHASCSEPFYREWVEQHIDQSKHSKDDIESRLRLLKFMQNLNKQEDEGDGEEEDEEESVSDFQERFSKINLDEEKVEEKIWDLLTEEERREFLQMVEKGEIQKMVPEWVPWWMADSSKKPKRLVEELGKSEEETQDGVKVQPLPDPPPNVPPFEQLVSVPVSANIANDVMNAIYAYAFLLRLYRGKHLQSALDFTQELLWLSGSLGRSESFGNVEEAVEAVILQIHEGGKGGSSHLLTALDDTRRIVTSEEHLASLFGDLYRTLSCARRSSRATTSSSRKWKMAPVHHPSQEVKEARLAQKKVVFYASWAEMMKRKKEEEGGQEVGWQDFVCQQLNIILETKMEEEALFKEQETEVVKSGVMEHCCSSGKTKPPKIQEMN